MCLKKKYIWIIKNGFGRGSQKSRFNTVNYLFILQSGKFVFYLSINVSLYVFSAYTVSVSGWERGGGRCGGMDISHRKRFPIHFAISRLINRLCTHAHSCQSLSELLISTVTPLSAAWQPLTQKHTHTLPHIYQTQACGSWWMGGWTGDREVNCDGWVPPMSKRVGSKTLLKFQNITISQIKDGIKIMAQS